MGRRQLWIAAALVSLAALLVGLLGRGRAPVLFGFNDNAVAQRIATAGQAAALLHDVGARVDRVQFDWRAAEPNRGQYDWAPYDAIYLADLTRGIRPLFNFAYAPTWADNGACDQRTANCLFPPSPDHYEDAARTVALLARRYPRLVGIEIWNEPNTAYFWQPRANPAEYTRLLGILYRAVKAVAPHLPVVGASLTEPFPGPPGNETMSNFLRTMYQNGAARSMDVLSVHPYPLPGDLIGTSAVTIVRQARTIEAAYVKPTKPLWLTETGISTSGVGGVSQRQQAVGLVHLYQRLSSQPGVDMVLFHTLLEAPAPASSVEPGFGIVRDDMSRKAAYCALRALMRDSSC